MIEAVQALPIPVFWQKAILIVGTAIILLLLREILEQTFKKE
jgi:hypothetical protein